MVKTKHVLLSLLIAAVVAGCASPGPTGETSRGLGAHGAWKRVGDREFDATYIAFRFDQDRKWIGSTKTRIHIIPGPGDHEFKAVAKVSTRDLQDNEIGTSEVRLEGKRIQAEPF